VAVRADKTPIPDDAVLVADIGGTNARFALAVSGAGAPPGRPHLIHQITLATADFASLQHAAEHYLERCGTRPWRAAFAVACPVTGDEIRLTNRAWAFSRSELSSALNLDELIVINDFGAVARAVPALGAGDVVALHGTLDTVPAAPVSVIGPGTGLGVALLVAGPDGPWQVIETEGGHISFAPQGDEEQCIAEWMTARHGRVSVERVLSGPGLARIHAALGGLKPGRTATPDRLLAEPAEIVSAALAGSDALARRAVARFCAILGSVAGDTALIHGARTLFIAGGIVPRFIPFLRASAFRERFLAKGRFAAHLETVALAVITHPDPGLLGAALAAGDAAPGGRLSEAE